MKSFLENEQIAEGKYPIHYVLQEHPDAEWLIVVFSAFAPTGHPVQHPYNFTNALDEVPANKLYIQDSLGRHGTYYLCNHMDFGVEECVSNLILDMQNRLLCPNERTISLGSSKGGSAAAYFALKHGFSHALAMVPQFRIGTYISSHPRNQETMEDMVGLKASAADFDAIDQLIFDVAKNNTVTKLHVLTSENDEQYAEQIVPFVEMLREEKLDTRHEIVLENRIVGHGAAADFNVDFTHRKLSECMFGAYFKQHGECLQFWQEQAEYTAKYVIQNKTGSSETFLLTGEPKKIFLNEISWGELCVFQRETEIYRRHYCPWVIDSLNASCTETESEWLISFEENEKHRDFFQYSFCVFDQNNVRLHQEGYTSEKEFRIPREGRTGKKIQFFWKYNNWRLAKSRAINVEFKDYDKFAYSINVEDNTLKFRFLGIEEHSGTQFAYYVKKDGQIILKQGYGKESYFDFGLWEPGKYSIIYFIRQGENIEYFESDEKIIDEITPLARTKFSAEERENIAPSANFNTKKGPLNRLKKYRFLFEELVKRDFKKKYKRTVLGMAWSVLSPLLMLLVMKLVFTQFFGRTTPHYTTYLFCGNLIFAYFNEATTQGMGALMGNAAIFSKVNVPKYLFLFSKNVQTLINFGLTLIVFFVFCILDGITFTWKFVLLLYPIALLVLFNIGVGLILSALYVFFRDIQYLWAVFTQLLMYLSAIFYTIDRYSPTVQNLFLLNPIYLFIRYFRKIVIEATIPTVWFHLLMLAMTAIILGIGCWMYKKYNHRFLYYV